MKKNWRVLFFLICGIFTQIFAQNSAVLPFSFLQSGSNVLQPTIILNGEVLKNPFSGGLNAAHIVLIDLNLDKEEDILIFDRTGGRILCFLFEPISAQDNEDNENNVEQNFHYVYHPEYTAFLPPLHSWVQACDYNADGKVDLFTFNGISGISVYKNVSELKNGKKELKFELLTSRLQAQMYGQYSSLYCTSVDYPALIDIDSDGAVDILNFWVPSTGDYLHYYKNYALETYGTLDSTDFRIEDWSWGCFAESEESNVIYLDSCRPNPAVSATNSTSDIKHSGSTICALPSATKENVYDLLLGDVGYNHLVYLYNTGSTDKAKISAYDTIFSLAAQAELPTPNLSSFPVVSKLTGKTASRITQKNDSLLLCISPYSSNAFSTQGKESIWLYAWNNKKQANIPESRLIQKDFLQNTTIDEGSLANPVFYDYNKDGLQDIVIAYYGQNDNEAFWGGLTLYENTGTATQPEFTFVTNDFLFLKNYELKGLNPAFGDYDMDGKDELILGSEDGRLRAFKVLFKEGKAHSAELIDDFFLGVEMINSTAPTLFDLDKDGYLDLIVGGKQQMWQGPTGSRYTKASLTYFRNLGSTQEKENVFEYVTDSLGRVNVIDRTFSNYGYSNPYFGLTQQGETYLYSGAQNGKIWMYRVNNIADSFEFMGYLPVWNTNPIVSSTDEEHLYSSVFSCGEFSSPAISDLNLDGYPDLIVGTVGGGLIYAQGIPYREPDTLQNEEKQPEPTSPTSPTSAKLLKAYPNPSAGIVYVEVDELVYYTLTNLKGQCIEHGYWTEGTQKISFSDFPSGIYFINFKGITGFGEKQEYKALKIVKP